MIRSLAVVTVVVEDQDEALEFYTDQLALELRTTGRSAVAPGG